MTRRATVRRGPIHATAPPARTFLLALRPATKFGWLKSATQAGAAWPTLSCGVAPTRTHKDGGGGRGRGPVSTHTRSQGTRSAHAVDPAAHLVGVRRADFLEPRLYVGTHRRYRALRVHVRHQAHRELARGLWTRARSVGCVTLLRLMDKHTARPYP